MHPGELTYPVRVSGCAVPLQAFAVLVIDEAQTCRCRAQETGFSDLERREKLLQVVLVGTELRSNLSSRRCTGDKRVRVMRTDTPRPPEISTT